MFLFLVKFGFTLFTLCNTQIVFTQENIST
uniref:Uncharacterized protein n=1 Tax=Arundo donax TaxID=35708 RepID=A0A0A9G6F8_ARUDO